MVRPPKERGTAPYEFLAGRTASKKPDRNHGKESCNGMVRFLQVGEQLRRTTVLMKYKVPKTIGLIMNGWRNEPDG